MVPIAPPLDALAEGLFAIGEGQRSDLMRAIDPPPEDKPHPRKPAGE